MISYCEITNAAPGVMKHRKDWRDDLSEYLNVGDLVDDEIIEYVHNVMPPTLIEYNIVQMGESYSDRPDENGKWHRTFSTFAKTEFGWVYAGHCFMGRYNNVD